MRPTLKTRTIFLATPSSSMSKPLAELREVTCLNLFFQNHDRHSIHSTARKVEPLIGRRDHVAHPAAARRNRFRAEALRFGIEPDQRVRLHSRLAVPNLAIVRNRDSI